MGQEDILSHEDGKNKKKSPRKHQNCKNRKDAGVEEGKRGMDILQPHHRDIPEQEDEDEDDQAGKNQQPDKESLLRLKVQKPSRITNIKCQDSKFKSTEANAKC